MPKTFLKSHTDGAIVAHDHRKKTRRSCPGLPACPHHSYPAYYVTDQLCEDCRAWRFFKRYRMKSTQNKTWQLIRTGKIRLKERKLLPETKAALRKEIANWKKISRD